MSTKGLSSILPPGTFIVVKALPLGTTAEQITEHFVASGIYITPACVSIRDYGRSALAFVSIPTLTVADLVMWALNGAALGGSVPVIEPIQRKERAA